MDFFTLKRWMYLTVIVSAVLSGGGALAQSPLSVARDPGVRGGAAGAGAPLAGLTARQFEFFADGKADFESVEDVPDGVGPRMNLDGCAGCHSQPAIGGRPHRKAIPGRTNNNGNDGTIARFGWKAQNKSLLLFAGEAYNVEMGISNELFQQEREEKPACQFATVPNGVTDTEATETPGGLSAIEHFAFFQRFLAPPTPSPNMPGGASSISNGRAKFVSVGCALCHTPTLTTGNSTVEALKNKPVNLFSDLLLHNMGPGLADDILQGEAAGDEFRSSPLWGLGQRIFFLHDGRTSDLLEAIQAHKSAGNAQFGPSEANAVIDNFNRLDEQQKQVIP